LTTDFGKKLKRLLEHPFNTDFKLDSACALACQTVGAACVSILIYSPQEEHWQIAGHYLDPKLGEVKITGDGLLYKIMFHMAACEYIYEIQASLATDNSKPWFADFEHKNVLETSTSPDQFNALLESFADWKESFERLKNVYRQARVSIGVDRETGMGEWFNALLLEKKPMGEPIFIENLKHPEQGKSNGYTFTAQYHVALPLSSVHGYFGVLEFLFPQETAIIKCIANEPIVEASYQETLEEIAEHLSQHVESDYVADSHTIIKRPPQEMRQDYLLESQRRMDEIRRMHRNMAKIFKEKERKCYDYINDFLREISELIDRLNIFPYHMIWECISEQVPENLAKADRYVLRHVTAERYRNVPLRKNDFFNYPRDEYFQVSAQLPKAEFSQQCLDYFEKDKLAKILELPLKPGYSHVDLPIFSENEKMPCWILTFFYREDRMDLDHLNDGNLFQLLEHLSFQIGLTWDKFQEKLADKLLDLIDYRLGGRDKTQAHSTLDQLRIISEILAREIQVDWCAFFVVDEQEYTLKLETSNVYLDMPLNYSLYDLSEITVRCFAENSPINLCGRERLEEILKAEKMLPIEKALRKENKPSKYKKGKHRFTFYVMLEHALLFPIALGTIPKGVMALYRSKNAGEPLPDGRFDYVMTPFSQFETYLLTQVKTHVFNIFISHYGVQRRMRDIRNIIDQVISPISESISATEKSIHGKNAIENTTKEELFDKLWYVNALSKIATHYVKNFEILLDIDTGKIKPRKSIIPDLRLYLIGFARIYTPLIRPKCIHINVTKDTTSDISIEVDKDLFEVVVLNMLDNAVKYSFDPEDRLLNGLQPKPVGMEDKENIQITAEADEHAVTITISSYGIEIKKSEKVKTFDREFRGVDALDRSKGTGIGLYLAKEIIGMHDGSIEIIPGTPKFNTVFKITLPKKIGNTHSTRGNE